MHGSTSARLRAAGRRWLTAGIGLAMIATLSACLAPDGRNTSAANQAEPASTSSTAPSNTTPSNTTPSSTAAPTPVEVPNAEGKKTGPVGMTGKWKLAWSDEFSGDELDTDKWRPNWLTNEDDLVSKPINRAEKACYDPDNVRVKSGKLRLAVTTDDCITHDDRRYANTAGQVESADDYTFSYGFAEAKIYLPPSDGTMAPAGSCGPNWMVFMLNGHHHPDDGEIDVMECLSDNDVAWHYHWGTEADPQVEGGYPDSWNQTMPQTSGGWHTFGVDWEPGKLTFYYDGVPVGTQTEGVTDAAHYLVLTQTASGSAVAEETAQVDWVRVWKRR